MKQLITNPYSFDSYKIETDSQGRAIVNAKIMTTGRLKYKNKNGDVFFGNISLEELEKAIPSANLKPITIKHPPGMLRPSDVTKHQKGFSADGYKIKEIDGKPWLFGPVVLNSEEALNVAESGELGVSAGYFRDAEPTGIDGEFNFKNIDINHIAIGCDNPRAKGAGLSLDEAEDDSARIYSFANQQKPEKKEVIMKQKLIAIKVGDFSMDEASIEYDESGTGTIQAIEKFQDRETKLVNKLVDFQESMDSLEVSYNEKIGDLTGETKGLNAKVEELEQEMSKMISLDDIDKMAEERADVKAELVARGIEDDFRTILEGKKLVVKHDFPNQSFDDSEIEGAYKTRNVDKKDLIERRKSNDALLKLKSGDHSMDSGDRVSFSQLDIQAMIRNKQLKAGRR